MFFAMAVGALALATGCVPRPRYRVQPPQEGPSPPGAKPSGEPGQQKFPRRFVSTQGAYQVGFSSYYAYDFHGKPTASGEIFDMDGLTAAHRELPLGTLIRVTHLENGRSVIVKVNDRGPFVEDRILDLSLGAARQLDMVQEGVAMVKIEIVREVE